MTEWYASMFHAHYGKKSWRADGNMKWKCFCESWRMYSSKVLSNKMLELLSPCGKVAVS